MSASRENGEILAAIQALRGDLQGLRADLQGQRSDFQAHTLEDRTSFAKLNETLVGTEKSDGLTTRVRTLEKTDSTERDNRKWMIRTLLGMLLTALGGLVWALIQMKAQGKLP